MARHLFYKHIYRISRHVPEVVQHEYHIKTSKMRPSGDKSSSAAAGRGRCRSGTSSPAEDHTERISRHICIMHVNYCRARNNSTVFTDFPDTPTKPEAILKRIDDPRTGAGLSARRRHWRLQRFQHLPQRGYGV